MAIVSLAPALPAPETVADAPQACARPDEHRRLTTLAVKWLRRANSSGGRGCQIALSEGWAGWGGEIPDAIGFRAAGYQNGTVIVEAKASRAEFLADARNPHPIQPETGLGRWRDHICSEGLTDPAALPERWGLLYATLRGAIRVVAGDAAALRKTSGMFHAGRFADASRPMLSRPGTPSERSRLSCTPWRVSTIASCSTRAYARPTAGISLAAGESDFRARGPRAAGGEVDRTRNFAGDRAKLYCACPVRHDLIP